MKYGNERVDSYYNIHVINDFTDSSVTSRDLQTLFFIKGDKRLEAILSSFTQT